jgi:hypothetical protein
MDLHREKYQSGSRWRRPAMASEIEGRIYAVLGLGREHVTPIDRDAGAAASQPVDAKPTAESRRLRRRSHAPPNGQSRARSRRLAEIMLRQST